MPLGCLPVKRIANQEINVTTALAMPMKIAMIAAGMIHRNRRPVVSRLADSSYEISVRTGALPGSVPNAGYGSKRRLMYPRTRL